MPCEEVAREYDPFRYKMLRNLPLEHRPKQMNFNIPDRCGPALRTEISKMLPERDASDVAKGHARWRINEKLLECAENYVVCDPMSIRAGGCGLHPHSDLCFFKDVPETAIHMKVGSIPCKDWSAQNQSAPRQAGNDYPAASMFFADCKVVEPDIVYT